ncbi:hypothetical protein PsorP6_017680 [Peronosclerospora sorghi]|uniref:Uncharacterized protein n=1 Tax=Peronosclerospora sorghi TaxID=230839 RepID=A0ACC0WP76_9STRA|nr:hypothetical protein PsorP6_017680 [Peronosclerospora sorghi]
MMNEVEPEVTSSGRLRRRSFFEGMETDGTSADHVALRENDVAPHALGSSSHSESESYGGRTFSLPGSSGNVGKGVADDLSGPERIHSTVHTFLASLYDMGRNVLLRLHLIVLTWIAKWPTVHARLATWPDALRSILRHPIEWIRPRPRDPAVPVKSWVYPTHYLTYATLSLVLIQLVLVCHYQTLSLTLQVHECIVQERLLAASDVSAATSRAPTSTAASLRFLERRFEQQQASTSRLPGQATRPWTCLAVVPTESDTSMAQAAALAAFWPRSQVLAAQDAPIQVASRVYVGIGAHPLVDPLVDPRAGGVVALLAPLSALRPALFVPRFPDLLLVKTEFALRQLVKVRQAQQEDADGGRPRGTTTPPRHFGIYLLRSTVPDIYDRHIPKHWDAFLHIVVGPATDTSTQYTHELLAAWVAHPTWPVLHVRFHKSLARCRAVERQLSTMANASRATNVDLVCDAAANAPPELVRLKNAIGMHVMPAPPEREEYEDVVLETLAVGALVVTYESPIMQEYVPETCGLRVGAYEYAAETDAPRLVPLPRVHVTPRDLEHAIHALVALDRTTRVAAGRAARVHYLRLRTHYLSAVVAMDAAVCEGDRDERLDTTWRESGLDPRRKVHVETMRAFLY